MQAWRSKMVAQQLRLGAVIAYPTEGVWGLGCDPLQQSPVAQILSLKQRSWEEGLIMACGAIEQVERYLYDVTSAERDELERAWPGPVTFLVPDPKGLAPEWIRGRHNTLALRVSDHPVIKAVCEEFRGPIVSTSANRSGKPSALDALRVRQYFPTGIDVIVPGKIGGLGSASEIRSLRDGQVLREAKRS